MTDHFFMDERAVDDPTGRIKSLELFVESSIRLLSEVNDAQTKRIEQLQKEIDTLKLILIPRLDKYTRTLTSLQTFLEQQLDKKALTTLSD